MDGFETSQTGTDPTGYDVDQGVEQQGNNPSWNEFLEVVPQEFHPRVTPILEKWDKGVQDRFQKVHSEYEPWKPFIKSGVDPQQAQFAMNLLYQLNDDPEMVYNAIKEHYKFGNPAKPEQGQPEPVVEEDPRISELQRQNEIIAQVLLSQREAEMKAQAEAELDKELSDLQKKYGEYDMEFVLAKMHSGKTGEEAVQDYMRWVNNQKPKPFIMGSGGGFPNNNTDVRKLSDKDTRSLVAQMLQATAAERQK